MVLKFLLVLFLIYFLVFRFFGFILKPFLGMIFSQAKQRHTGDTYTHSSQKEGEIRIDQIPSSNKKSSKNFPGGEYVDYEEMD
jgi:hypothetical protein